MKEPFLTQFREMIRAGASSQDIHDAGNSLGYASESTDLSDHYVEREIRRVESHQNSLLPVLEKYAGKIGTILDVGCNTGGTTVALALSEVLQADEVVGVDPNRRALEAARVRVLGHDLDHNRVRFQEIMPGEPLPYDDGQFDLTTCVSVLEFVSKPSARVFFASEIQRVTKPGGCIFLATPSPWRMREYHSRRLLGHFFPREGYPWASTPLAIRRMFHLCERIPISDFIVRDTFRRRHVTGFQVFTFFSPWIAACLPWQKHLFRKCFERPTAQEESR